MPLSGFEPATHWSEVQHSTSGLLWLWRAAPAPWQCQITATTGSFDVLLSAPAPCQCQITAIPAHSMYCYLPLRRVSVRSPPPQAHSMYCNLPLRRVSVRSPPSRPIQCTVICPCAVTVSDHRHPGPYNVLLSAPAPWRCQITAIQTHSMCCNLLEIQSRAYNPFNISCVLSSVSYTLPAHRRCRTTLLSTLQRRFA